MARVRLDASPRVRRGSAWFGEGTPDAATPRIVDKGLCIVLTLMTGAALFAAEACTNETARPPVTDQLGNEPAPGAGVAGAGGSAPGDGTGAPGSSGGDTGSDSDSNPDGALPPAGTTPTNPGAGTGTTTSTGGLGTTSTGGLGTSSGTSSGTSGTLGTSSGFIGSTASSTGG